MAFKKFGFKKNFPRKMVKGSWQCSDCGGEITELPFQPLEGRPVYCRECWRKKKGEGI